MKRREFITGIGGAAVWPMTARAQQAMPVVGFLGNATPDLWADRLRAFHQGLSETGYAEGRNVKIEYRWAEDNNARIPTLANDLVRRQVSVIAAGSTSAALAAKAVTTTIPIVFSTAGDPVEIGLVGSLSRPGGNITGATNLNAEILPKRLELLHELVPATKSIALLVNPTAPSAERISRGVKAAARALGLQLHVVNAATERDFETVFATLAQFRAGGLVVGTDPFFTGRRVQLAALTVRYAVPAIYQYREFAASGGLMSYGGSLTDMYRLNGVYAGRILNGEKPSDLPVQQATKAELIINLKTAKIFGLAVTLPMLGRADEVIE